MGFNVNFNNKPVITGAQQSQDGGAGNLGYFEQGENEEKKNKQDELSLFDKKENLKGDTFENEVDSNVELESFSFTKLIAKIIFTIKSWFQK